MPSLTSTQTRNAARRRAEKRWWFIEPDAALVVVLVLAALGMLYGTRPQPAETPEAAALSAAEVRLALGPITDDHGRP